MLDKVKTYKIVRIFLEKDNEVVETGLTLAEAQAWCRDLETSSGTATGEEAKAITAKYGPWFDGYEVERNG